MPLTMLGTLIVSLWLLTPPAAEAGDVDINVNLGGPPPVIRFDREPKFVVIPESRVWRLPDYEYDFYRHDDDYYLNRDGHWYRAKSWRGPFEPFPFDRLPRVIVDLPGEYRRHPAHPHGGPPGQLKKHGIDVAPGHNKGGGHRHGKAKGKSKKH